MAFWSAENATKAYLTTLKTVRIYFFLYILSVIRYLIMNFISMVEVSTYILYTLMVEVLMKVSKKKDMDRC